MVIHFEKTVLFINGFSIPFLILGYCLDYHIVLLSCCLFHCIYWNQAVTANQGKIWGISRNTIYFSLVPRASRCCHLGHCHSLNSVELPHFTPARDGACSSCFCQQDVTAQLAKFMKKIKSLKFWKWITIGLKHISSLKLSTNFRIVLILTIWFLQYVTNTYEWFPWLKLDIW